MPAKRRQPGVAVRVSVLTGSAALTAFLLVGCVESTTVTCQDGRVCGAGLVCDDAHQDCVDPELIDACRSKSNGDACTAVGLGGVCDLGVCIPGECGNGILEVPEVCDDGNTADGDGCSADCASTSCGDGVVELAEQCDTAVALTAQCIDFGFDRGPLSCTNACVLEFDRCQSYGWKRGEFIATSEIFRDIWVAPGGQIFGVGFSFGLSALLATIDGALVRTYVGGGGLNAIWGDAIDNVYAVGISGFVWHFDGFAWTQLDTGFAGNNASVWGDGSRVFVGSNGRILMFDGGSWTSDAGLQPAQDFVSIVGNGDGDVFASRVAPAEHRLLQRSGPGSWSDITAQADFPIFDMAAADSTVVAVGENGQAAIYDGTTWRSINTFTGITLRSVVARSTNDIYAVADSGTAMHFNGTTWAMLETDTDGSLGSLAMSSSRILALEDGIKLREYFGSAFERLEIQTQVRGVWSSGRDYSVVIDGTRPYILQGSRFQPTPMFPTITGLQSVSGRGEGDFEVSNGLAVDRLTGISWTSLGSPPGSTTEILAAQGRVYAAGNSGSVAYYDGQWNAISLTAQSMDPVADLWHDGTLLYAAVGGIAPDEGQGGLFRFDGTNWTSLLGATAYSSVWGASPDDVYATNGPLMWHFDGTDWTSVDLACLLTRVRGSATDDVFATCGNGSVFHFDGTAWAEINIEPSVWLDIAVTEDMVQLISLFGELTRLVRTTPW